MSSTTDPIETTPEIEEPTTPDDGLDALTPVEVKKIFDDLVAQGVITPSKDPAHCLECQEPLEEIKVVIRWNDDDTQLTADAFSWNQWAARFIASPSFYGFCEPLAPGEAPIAHFDATCAKCGGFIGDLVIVDHPHGLTFGAMTKMAGVL